MTHQTLIKIVCLLFLFIEATNANLQCFPYLEKLAELYKKNRTQFNSEIAPYAILSGKNIDDLGYPDYCNRNPNYTYTTVQAKVITNTSSQYSIYLGFCFTSKCSTTQLNEGAQFLIDYILEDYEVDGKAKFVEPALQLEFSGTTLITCLIFSVFVIIAMVSPIIQWIRLCQQSQQEEYIIKSTYIDLENPNKDIGEDEQLIDDDSSFWDRLSLKYKWKQLWKDEQSTKIKAFAYFRFASIPLIVLGQYFFLTNKAAFNYTSFNEQIYGTFYAKFIMFSYYLPDIFFFISGFLISQKLFSSENSEESKNVLVLKSVVKKFTRLYPIYIAVFIIYWLVTPGLHAGPVWFVYEDEAAICNTHWWKVLLLIDNWFPNSCYPALWFVQVQIQFVFVAASFFLIYFKNKQASYIYLGLITITSWILLFVLSADLIVEVDTAMSNYTQLYFRSFYSHIFFYLFGILMALLASIQKIKDYVRNFTSQGPIMSVLMVFSVVLIIFIMARPSVWSSLGFELGLCRTGVLLSFLILFLSEMFSKESHVTNIHKFEYYLYPVILVSYMIAECSFWAAGSFPYVSSLDLLNAMVPILIISYGLGIFLGLLYDLRTLFVK